MEGEGVGAGTALLHGQNSDEEGTSAAPQSDYKISANTPANTLESVRMTPPKGKNSLKCNKTKIIM